MSATTPGLNIGRQKLGSTNRSGSTQFQFSGKKDQAPVVKFSQTIADTDIRKHLENIETSIFVNYLNDLDKCTKFLQNNFNFTLDVKQKELL